MEHEGIWQEDIARLRRKIKLGDKITVNAHNPDELSGSARNPAGKKRLPVSGIYPHLVTAYDKKSGLTYSRTYVDMLTPEPGKKGGVTGNGSRRQEL